MTQQQLFLIVCALSLALGACAGPGAIHTVSIDGALRSFKTIPNSKAAPCAMQKAVAAHNSAYDSLRHKREVVYRAPCDVDKGARTATPGPV